MATVGDELLTIGVLCANTRLVVERMLHGGIF